MKTPEQLRKELNNLKEDLRQGDLEPDYRRELEARSRTIQGILGWFHPDVQA